MMHHPTSSPLYIYIGAPVAPSENSFDSCNSCAPLVLSVATLCESSLGDERIRLPEQERQAASEHSSSACSKINLCSL